MERVKLFVCIVFSMLFINTTCDDDDFGTPQTDCDQFAITNNSLYEDSESDFYSIINAEVLEDCLKIEVSASGCSGETWEFSLLAREDVMESLPVQRSIKLVLVNQEACLAVFTREVSFDLTNLQVEGENEVKLNLEDYAGDINYNY